MITQQIPNVRVPKFSHDPDAYVAYIVKKTEGRLFLHEYIAVNILRKGYISYTRMYYTAKDGQVYMVKDGLHLQTDTLNSLLEECVDVGVYDPANEPKGMYSDDISLVAFRKRFGIPPIEKPKQKK